MSEWLFFEFMNGVRIHLARFERDLNVIKDRLTTYHCVHNVYGLAGTTQTPVVHQHLWSILSLEMSES